MEDNNNHLLLVEDEEEILFVMKSALKGMFGKISEARDGLEALRCFEESKESNCPVHLIITDIMMPQMNGIELIDSLQDGDEPVPVIAVSCAGSHDVLKELLNRGVEAFIDKPFTLQDLRSEVKRVLHMLARQQEALCEKVRYLEQETLKLRELFGRYYEGYHKLMDEVAIAEQSYKNLIYIREEDKNVTYNFLHQPLTVLGGDYFNIRKTPVGCDVFIADVSGHDFGASYNTVLLKAFFDENCRHGKNGTDFFNLLNHQLLRNNKVPRLVTATFASVDLETMTAEIVTAAHPPVLHLRNGGSVVKPVSSEGGLLGMFEGMEYNARTVKLRKGDRLLFYTDGIPSAPHTEPETGEEIQIGMSGFLTLVRQFSELSQDEMLQRIWDYVQCWCQQKPDDDLLLFSLEI